jgi:hypothetical protein
MSRHLKGAAGSGTGLFKNQRHVFALMELVCENSFFLFVLEVRRQIYKI